MYTLAVDPGVHTGVALLNPQGDVVWTLTCEDPYDELTAALREYQDAELATEPAPPTRHYQEVYATVFGLVTQEAGDRTVHLIRPSEWKNHPFCNLLSTKFATKHEAEAVGIGRALTLRRQRGEIGPADPSPDREHQKSS